MESNNTQFTATPFIPYNRRNFVGVVLAGILTGIITVLLGILLQNFIIEPALCKGSTPVVCAENTAISFHVASIIGALVSLVVLVRFSIYRPLLVVIAAIISTWGLFAQLTSHMSLSGSVLLVVLAVLVYTLFTWLLRPYNFLIALGSSAIAMVTLLLISRQ